MRRNQSGPSPLRIPLELVDQATPEVKAFFDELVRRIRDAEQRITELEAANT